MNLRIGLHSSDFQALQVTTQRTSNATLRILAPISHLNFLAHRILQYIPSRHRHSPHHPTVDGFESYTNRHGVLARTFAMFLFPVLETLVA